MIKRMGLVGGISKRAKVFGLLLALIIIAIVTFELNASAETYPGGSDNGLTSRISSLSSDLGNLGYGSTTDSDDWGAMWNRIKTSAKWAPSGDITAQDVRSGKKFYNNSRTEQAGTMSSPGICSTQSYADSFSGSTKESSCSSDWTTPGDSVSGTDKQDPVSGLIWSYPLYYSSGQVSFSPSSMTVSFSWNANGSSNNSLTAIQLCQSMDNGWRLPTQKEMMQAYIDGAHYNLVSADASFWSATAMTDALSSNVFFVSPGMGSVWPLSKSDPAAIRCVR